MSILNGCNPREEVLRSDLNDAIFAADFGNLIAGTVPKVYKGRRTFFRDTHPAQQLCRVIQAVFARLACACCARSAGNSVWYRYMLRKDVAGGERPRLAREMLGDYPG